MHVVQQNANRFQVMEHFVACGFCVQRLAGHERVNLTCGFCVQRLAGHERVNLTCGFCVQRLAGHERVNLPYLHNF